MGADPDPIEEQHLGKYRIGRELGRGGFATVFAAEDMQLGRQVALKVLHPALMADPTFVQGFERDARAAAALEHPNIATIYELGQEGGRLFIAQQLLAGGTLGARIAQRSALPYPEAVRVTREIAAALDVAHAAGMVHRDVKPANILFNARDEAVLTDFGLVRAIEQSAVARSSAGGMVGTPAYMAPELWEDAPGGPEVDTYALGCVVFEMMTGQVLFAGATPPAVMRAHFSPRRFPERWPQGVPTEVRRVLERALDANPQARFASAGALAEALARAQPAAAPPTPQPPAPTRRRKSETDGAPRTRKGSRAKAPDDTADQAQTTRYQHRQTAVPTATREPEPPRDSKSTAGTIAGLPDWVPELVVVPAGPFLMGSSTNWWKPFNEYEMPQHTLVLPAYWIGRTEVTNAQFRPFVEGDGYTNQAYWTVDGWAWRVKRRVTQPSFWNDSQWNTPKQPVVGVTWYEAVAYCRWLSAQTGHPFRLPSEAEWEKAARGTDGRIWPWGNTWAKGRANTSEAGINRTTPVGQYPAGASPYGALDMAGNVYEWCATVWRKLYPYSVEDEWTTAYLKEKNENSFGTNRVYRGGSWNNDRTYARGGYRFYDLDVFTGSADNTHGLRVASSSSSS